MTTINEEHGKRVARDTLIVRSFIVVSTAILGAILFFSVNTAADTNAIVSGIEEQQDNNTHTLSNGQEILHRIVDCTEPGGKCFGEGQQRTASAVGALSRISIYASACAADPRLLDRTLEQRAHAIQHCVRGLLASGGR